MPETIRSIQPEELPDWFASVGHAFYVWASDPHALAEARRPSMDLERTIGAFDGDTIVGTYRTFATRLTLPGGARVPVSAVTAVTVRPTHRRRGTLTRLIADDVRRTVERGEAASVLIASEWPIYGRYGFGPATWNARWTLRTRDARLQVDPVGTVELLDPLAARQLLPAVYDAYAVNQPGEIDRDDARWDVDLGLIELSGRPRWRGSIALHRNDAGTPDGYARYHGEEVWEEGMPDNLLVLDELHGVTPAAELDLWRFLAQMDLTARIRADSRREREPMPWYLTDARAARVTNLTDFLWLRVLDVQRLLGERRYERDGALVVAVRDLVAGEPGPAAGTYRLHVEGGSATCARTDEPADLSVGVRSLGAAILGGTRLVDAARAEGAEGVTEHRPGSLAAADALLRTAESPWSTTWF